MRNKKHVLSITMKNYISITAIIILGSSCSSEQGFKEIFEKCRTGSIVERVGLFSRELLDVNLSGILIADGENIEDAAQLAKNWMSTCVEVDHVERYEYSHSFSEPTLKIYYKDAQNRNTFLKYGFEKVKGQWVISSSQNINWYLAD